MHKAIRVRKIVIGEGMPKICVPVGGATGESVLDEAAMVASSNADIVEWRADFFQECAEERICGVLPGLRDGVGDMPLMFTYRTKGEGGQAGFAAEEYAEMYCAVMEAGHVDMVDIELSCGDKLARKLADAAHQVGLIVVISCQDTKRTPPKEELLKLFHRMRDAGADIPKLAVMPHSFNDILTLLAATDEFVRDAACPLISMSMSGAGSVSRLLGEVCGSSVTYGSMRRTPAGDGAPAVDDLRTILDLLHKKG